MSKYSYVSPRLFRIGGHDRRTLGLTFYVGAGGEEAAFACEDGEDGFGVLVEVADCCYSLLKDFASKGIELLGPVELDNADLALHFHDDVFIFGLHDGRKMYILLLDFIRRIDNYTAGEGNRDRVFEIRDAERELLFD